MARKDVDLVIRARDQAGKVVTQITEALNAFNTAQGNMTAGATKTTTAMSGLGAAFQKLDVAIKGMQAADKVARDFDRAQQSTNRLQAELAQVEARAARTGRSLSQMDQRVEQLTGKVVRGTEALNRQKAALKEAGTAQGVLSGQITNTQTRLDGLTRKIATGSDTQTRYNERLDAARARYSQLAEQIAATDSPTKRLVNSFEASQRALERATASVEKQRTKMTGLKADLEQTRASLDNLRAGHEQATSTTGRYERMVAQTQAALNRHSTELRAASVAQKALTTVNASASASAEKLAGEYAQTTRELDRLTQETNEAEAAVRKLSATMTGAMRSDARRAMLEVSQGMATARAAMQAADAGAARAARSDQARVFGTQPSEGLVRAQRAAAEARREFLQYRVAVDEMRRAHAMMDGTVEGNRAGLLRLQQAQRNLAASLAAIREAQARVQQATTSATAATQRQAAATRQLQAAQDPGRVSSFAATMRVLGFEKRTALSWTQRLRGEVLGLISAYAGLYGAINLLRETVKATLTLEAAQNRLGVVMGQDLEKTNVELDWLRRNADRLGITMSVLADEYSKFAVAASGANFAGESTRDIFLSVAESARVNKNSMEQMSGIFLALTQMISKGKVTSEELRRQLGDRLAGAFNIFADALGYTTEQLDDMMRKGEVLASEENLLKFADEMRRRFGPQLEDALNSTTTLLGRFQNAVFQTLLAFGEAGFIESFDQLLRDLTETLKSPDFRTFAEGVSRAIASVVDGIGWLIRNFRLVAAAATALIGYRLVVVWTAVRAELARTAGAAAATTVQLGRTSRAAVGLVRSLRMLASASLPGLLATGAAALIGYWLTGASQVNEALTEHLRIMDEVRNAYERTDGSLEKWREALSDRVTITEARKNLEDLENSLDSLADKLTSTANISRRRLIAAVNPFTSGAGLGVDRAYFQQVQAVIERWRSGAITARAMRDDIIRLNEQFRDGSRANKQYGEDLDRAIKPIIDAADSIERTTNVITGMTGATEDATAAMHELNNVVDTTAEDLEKKLAANAAKFAGIMEELNKRIPSVKREMDYLAESNAIKQLVDDTIELGLGWESIAQAVIAAGRAMDNLNLEFNREQFREARDAGPAGDVLAAARQFIGLSENRPDDNQLLQNLFKQANVNIDPKMVAWCAAFVNAVLATQGLPGTGRLNARSFLDYGESTQDPRPGDLVVLRRGNSEWQGHVGFFAGYSEGGGVRVVGGNQGDAVSEATFSARDVLAFRRVPGQAENELAALQRINEEERKRSESTEAFRLARQRATEDAEFELSIENQALVARETARLLREQELAAQEAGTVLTAQERADIVRTTEAKYRQKQIEEEIAEIRDRASKAEERVSTLSEHRAALLEQMRTAAEDGDIDGAEALREKIAEVNEQLVEAIANAQEMWQAVGGEASEAAIARLENARQAAQRFNAEGRQGLVDWKRVGDLFVDGLTNAFGEFSKAVAEGMSIGEAARNAFLKFAADFLIQIGQMIVKQAILNALQGTRLGGLFGMPAVGVSVLHTGGMAGSGGGSRRTVSAGLFANAARYHSGGYPGLRPNEVPIIAERGEQILAKDDPLNALNGGGGQGPASAASPRPVKIVNRLSSREVAQAVFDDDDGSEVIENYFRVNASKISAILSGG